MTPWTPRDLASWRDVVRLGLAALAEPQAPGVVRELGSACRLARRACFPTTRRDQHAPLADLLALGALYVRGTAAERQALAGQLRASLEFAAAIVAQTTPAPARPPTPPATPAEPWYLRD